MTKPIGDNFFYVAFHTFGLFLYHSFMDRVLNNAVFNTHSVEGQYIMLCRYSVPFLELN